MLSFPLPGPADAPAPVAAVLLVLVPPRDPAAAPLRLFPPATQADLQRRLGPAVRVLRVDAAEHPTVVGSLTTGPLPACVLLLQGTELWQQAGLPETAELAALVQARLVGVT